MKWTSGLIPGTDVKNAHSKRLPGLLSLPTYPSGTTAISLVVKQLTIQVQILRICFLGKGVTPILLLQFLFPLISAVTEKSVLATLNLRRGTILFQLPCNITNSGSKCHIEKGTLSCPHICSWLKSMFLFQPAYLMQTLSSTCIFTGRPNLFCIQ
jgi:hypothetical protein